MFRYLTAGESHGEELVGIVEGFPANFKIDIEFINNELRNRQMGFGRSERMKMENDKIEILSGVSDGITTGNPISFCIRNNGKNKDLKEVLKPRPGHADLVGYLKYNQLGSRNILERASARETASRVAIGALCKQFLEFFNIKIYSHIVKIGEETVSKDYYNGLIKDELYTMNNQMKIIDELDRKKITQIITNAIDNGDSLGGDIEIIVENTPLGLGSYTNWDKKLDGKLSQAIMSIQAIKSIEIGNLSRGNLYNGSIFHDEIIYNNGYSRKTNNAGGIEGGMSNGEDIVLKIGMKPIPTLKMGMNTVDINTKIKEKNEYERSDVCAVPSASVVCENVVATILAQEFLNVFGADFMEEIVKRYDDYLSYLKEK